MARSAYLSARGRGARLSQQVHLLAGHDIGGPDNPRVGAFERLLDQIARDADIVRVERAVDLIRSGAPVARPTVAFTFDDGFIDCHQHLAPALEAFDVNAAFFVNSRYVDAPSRYIERFNREAIRSPGRLPMDAEMVRDLADRGFVIGAHTGDHRRLDTNDSTVIDDQVVACRSEVEALTGRPCTWFAWPYGGYGHISETALRRALDTYDLVFSSDRYERYSSHGGRVLNRRHFEVYWPYSHVRFFLAPARSFT